MVGTFCIRGKTGSSEREEAKLGDHRAPDIKELVNKYHDPIQESDLSE
jgi:hypothetical protein